MTRHNTQAKVFQSTLMGMNGFMTYDRRDGNSTRLIDNAIQIIFEGKVCVVKDHHMYGAHREANQHLFRGILKRLASEHNLNWLIENKGIRIDNDKLHIELLPNPRYVAYIDEINHQLEDAFEKVLKIPELIEKSQMTEREWRIQLCDSLYDGRA